MRVPNFLAVLLIAATSGGQTLPGTARPYRLSSVDLKRNVIWGAECRRPDGAGLAFGGQDQNASDGRPHTRILVDGEWDAIHVQLRSANPLQELHARAWALRCNLKDARARARYVYFQGLSAQEESEALTRAFVPSCKRIANGVTALIRSLQIVDGDVYARNQAGSAIAYLERSLRLMPRISGVVAAVDLKSMYQAQILLALAAEALDAEPPARAIDCGARRKEVPPGLPAQGIVYDAVSGLYILLGGDHLDYLTNDTWGFDPTGPRWFQRHPRGAPPPRANHRLESLADGVVRLTGGYTYASNPDYCGGQYVDLSDGEWTYNIRNDEWTGDGLVPPDTRVYRTGPFHPDFYLQGDRPNAADFHAWLAALPANRWMPTTPPYRPRLNRDWGTARIDPDRDMILRWSGGHSAHGGTDVPHFHFSTNRWELPFPVEFPLGQLYANTSYPNGFNFNRRPWMTGHTYQNYAYDSPSKTMVKAGRPHHFYVYDPGVGDWVGRGPKPPAMVYNSCFYTLTLASTRDGVVSWGGNGKVCRFDGQAAEWRELELTGDPLPGAYVDSSSMVYDSARNRVLIFNTGGYRVPYGGQVFAVDLNTNTVQALSPQGMQQAPRFAQIDRSCYDAANDLVLMATHLKDAGDWTPTPAYDCAGNRWIVLDLKYEIGERYGRTTRGFPSGRSAGVMFDPKRKLIWGTDTNSQVYVLRLDPEAADR